MPHRGWAMGARVVRRAGGLGAGRIDRGAAASLVAACSALIVALPAGTGEFGLVVPAITASALATVLALVLGSRAKARIERSRGFLRGRALATAGIVLGGSRLPPGSCPPSSWGLLCGGRLGTASPNPSVSETANLPRPCTSARPHRRRPRPHSGAVSRTHGPDRPQHPPGPRGRLPGRLGSGRRRVRATPAFTLSRGCLTLQWRGWDSGRSPGARGVENGPSGCGKEPRSLI